MPSVRARLEDKLNILMAASSHHHQPMSLLNTISVLNGFTKDTTSGLQVDIQVKCSYVVAVGQRRASCSHECRANECSGHLDGHQSRFQEGAAEIPWHLMRDVTTKDLRSRGQ